MNDYPGFAIDDRTGAPNGLLPLPLPVAITSQFPKWVRVHPSHVVRREDRNGKTISHLYVPEFPEFTVDHNGHVSVLVADSIHEAYALTEKGKMAFPAPKPEPPTSPSVGYVQHPPCDGHPYGWWELCILPQTDAGTPP